MLLDKIREKTNEALDTLLLTDQEKADRKRFEELYDKPFREYFGIEDKGVSKSRELVSSILYGGYDKKEATEVARNGVVVGLMDGMQMLGDEAEKERAAMAATVSSEGYSADNDKGKQPQGEENTVSIASVYKAEAMRVINNDLEAIQKVNVAVSLGERAAYYDWVNKEAEYNKYVDRTENACEELFVYVSAKVKERCAERFAPKLEAGMDNAEKNTIQKKGGLAPRRSNANQKRPAERGGQGIEM